MFLYRDSTITVLTEVTKPDVASLSPLWKDEINAFFSKIETEMDVLLSTTAEAGVGKFNKLVAEIKSAGALIVAEDNRLSQEYAKLKTQANSIAGMTPLKQSSPIAPYYTEWRDHV